MSRGFHLSRWCRSEQLRHWVSSSLRPAAKTHHSEMVTIFFVCLSHTASARCGWFRASIRPPWGVIHNNFQGGLCWQTVDVATPCITHIRFVFSLLTISVSIYKKSRMWFCWDVHTNFILPAMTVVLAAPFLRDLECVNSTKLLNRRWRGLCQAFSNMTQSMRRALCAVMEFVSVDSAGTVVLNDGDQMTSWSVVLNGHLEVSQPDGSIQHFHMGDRLGFNVCFSFGEFCKQDLGICQKIYECRCA